MMIVAQSGPRLWAWDFKTMESLSWDERIMVYVYDRTMIVERKPANARVCFPKLQPSNEETDVNLRVLAGLTHSEAKERDHAG